MKQRKAKVQRTTRETDIRVDLNLDGDGRSRIDTGLPFFNHMLELLSKHSLIDLALTAKGDLDVDAHHTVEDIGITLGGALDRALGDRKGIFRYGWSYVPMDDALRRVAIDLGGRPYLVFEAANRRRKVGGFDVTLIPEFLQAFSVQGRLNLHAAQLYGRDPHHAYESLFKALARALRMACAPDARVSGVPSSKGTL